MVVYRHHEIACHPKQWSNVAANLASDTARATLATHDCVLYGIWRSQIGRPRDELNAITVSHAADGGGSSEPSAIKAWLDHAQEIKHAGSRAMHATLRPAEPTAPIRQGNYAFRSFSTPSANWDEFLALCADAWPGFEAAYDSQVIGLWEYADATAGMRESLLMTRRPNLAMWERSKLPASPDEADVRRKLSRRYDLCEATAVHTTTLITATDEIDDARWS